MSAHDALAMCARLLGVLALVQAWEFFRIQKVITDTGVWRWPDLEAELGKPFRFLLSEKAFAILNLARALAAVDVLINVQAHSILVLFLIHVLTLLRWLGTFNGGSDYMNLLLLWLTALGLSGFGNLEIVCVYYITFQLCLSYFKAGWIKLRNPNWRSGRALPAFLNSPIYEWNSFTHHLAHNRAISRLLSWVIIIYEVSFPLAALNPHLAVLYLVSGMAFHLGNGYFFGLNRFFFAWIAAYPALFYLALQN